MISALLKDNFVTIVEMGIPCAVSGCPSVRNPDSSVTFHRINRKLLPLWQQAVEMNITAYARICSLHFKPDDFVVGKSGKELKRDAVPSIGVIHEIKEDTSDEDEDNKTLQELLANGRNFVAVQHRIAEVDQFEMVISEYNSAQCNAKMMQHVGVQAERKTDKEEAMQTKIKVLGMRLKRREKRISYMNTVIRMIKNLVKGTDMEYKLCCELQKISETPSKSVKKITKDKGLDKAGTHGDDIGNSNSDEWESDDDTGMCVEVAFSPNLNCV